MVRFGQAEAADPFTGGQFRQVLLPLRLVAPWRDGAPVPIRHTCDGEDVSPALTSVQQPFEAMAHATVQLLGTAPDSDGAARELRFRPELVVRSSTGAAHLAGPPTADAGPW